MTGLDSWVTDATRHLARDSAARVRSEIGEHYESARDAAIADGATAEQAGPIARNALGGAKAANRQYRRVLLTCAEAKMLREGNWEARAVCGRPWLKRMVLGLPVVVAAVAAALFLTGHLAIARDLLIGGLGMSPLLAVPLLPIYTRSRSRVFRWVKWLAMSGALLLIFGPRALQWSWLLCSCLWPLVWTEWTRASIRRKLPIEAWPKQLYL